MNKHPFTFGPSRSQEHRLLRFDTRAPTGTAAESFDAYENMRNNADLKTYLSFFSNLATLSKYPALQNSPDREFFNAFILNEALPDNYDYKTLTSKDMNGADMFGLLKRFGADDAKIGEFLRLNCTEFANNQLAAVGKTDAQIGAEYRAKIVPMQNNWQNNQAQPNQYFIDATVDYYFACKTDVNTFLDAARITPAIDMNESAAIAAKKLTRQEYLVLLQLRWKGDFKKVSTALAGKTEDEALAALRQYFLRTNVSKNFKKLLTAHVDVSVGSMSENETLNRYGVVLGPGLLGEYIRHTRGALPKGSVNVPNQSAVAWEHHPEFAYEFLNGRLPATAGNQEFLRALRFHRVLNDAQRVQELKDHPENKPKMSREDADTILGYIINTLRERERVISDSMTQRTDWKQKERFAETLERHGGQLIDYVKNFSEHPVGSGIFALGGFLVARKVWKTIFGGKEGENAEGISGWRMLWQTSVMLGLGTVGLHLYARETTGQDVFDFSKGAAKKTWRSAQEFIGIDPDHDPTKETFPLYWSNELGEDPELASSSVTNEQMQYAISELQDKQIGTTLEWYERMEAWRKAGGAGSPPPLPFAIYKKSKLFGSMPSKDVANVFHQTLHRFFYNRGKTLSVDTRTARAGGFGFAEKGYSYIRDTYYRNETVRTLAAQYQQGMQTLTIDHDMNPATPDVSINFADPFDPNLAEFIATQPELYKKISVGRILFSEQMKEQNMAKMEMWQMFLAESDPKILAATGAAGARLASLIQDLQNEVDQAAILAARGGLVLPPLGGVGHAFVAGDEILVGRGPVIFDGINLPQGAVLPDGAVLPPTGIILHPPTTLPKGVVLPENVLIPLGITLTPPTDIPKGAVLGAGFAPPKGTKLTENVDAKGAVLTAEDLFIGPGTLLQDGQQIGKGAIIDGTQIPKGTVFLGPVTLRATASIVDDSGVRIPPGSRVDPAVEITRGTILVKDLVLQSGTVIKAGTVIEGGTGASLPAGTVTTGLGGTIFGSDYTVPGSGWKVD